MLTGITDAHRQFWCANNHKFRPILEKGDFIIFISSGGYRIKNKYRGGRPRVVVCPVCQSNEVSEYK